MLHKLRHTIVLLGLSLLAGCSTPSVDSYANKQPTFELNEFFNGPLVAHGILKNRSGLVTRTFMAQMQGTWQNGVGTLDEHFVFDDGEVQQRTWTLTPNGDGTYHASAGDVVEPGTARLAGNALFMNYVLSVPYDGDTLDLSVDDRMYLVTPDVLINESVLTKFGFEVASLAITIRKLAP